MDHFTSYVVHIFSLSFRIFYTIFFILTHSHTYTFHTIPLIGKRLTNYNQQYVNKINTITI